MNEFNLSSHYPILDIQDNLVFAANGNLVIGYQFELPEIYSLSEKDFEALHAQFFQAIKSLPVGTIVHKQNLYRKSIYKGDQLQRETFLQKATYHYFKGRNYLEHQSYLYFILPASKTTKASGYINPFKTVKTVPYIKPFLT